jgi:L-alanine-DL-glutamate epimerase-like enolase superfamily enzyme
VERNRDILRVFKNKNIGERWVIDANASWEVKNAISLLETIVELKIREKIMYIEQPFPVKFSVE